MLLLLMMLVVLVRLAARDTCRSRQQQMDKMQMLTVSAPRSHHRCSGPPQPEIDSWGVRLFFFCGLDG